MVHLVSHLRYKIIYLFKHLTKKKHSKTCFNNIETPTTPSGSVNINKVFKNHEKIVLLLGSERNGIENVNLVDTAKDIESKFAGIGSTDDPCSIANLNITNNVENITAEDMGTGDDDYDAGF